MPQLPTFDEFSDFLIDFRSKLFKFVMLLLLFNYESANIEFADFFLFSNKLTVFFNSFIVLSFA